MLIPLVNNNMIIAKAPNIIFFSYGWVLTISNCDKFYTIIQIIRLPIIAKFYQFVMFDIVVLEY